MPADRYFSRVDALWLQMLLANAMIILALKMFSFQKILGAIAWLADRTTIEQRESKEAFIARSCHRIRQIKQHGPIRGKCLSHSLVLYGVLRRYGIRSEILIGVQTTEGTFSAHAWVEVDNKPVNAGPMVRMRHDVFSRSFGGELL